MTRTYFSGDYYMTISNEKPMTDDGKTYCKFDLIKNINNIICPVSQFGTIEEILDTLKGWRKISNLPEYDCIREINADKHKMENYFISILEKELEDTTK